MNNLKLYRKRAGISQNKLSTRLGISVRTLQDYEQERKQLEKAAAITVLNISKELGCTIEELINQKK